MKRIPEIDEAIAAISFPETFALFASRQDPADVSPNTNREISGVELFGDYGRQRPVEEGDPLAKPSAPSRQISGEDLFGDAGSPEALAILFKQKAAKPEKFAGLKKAVAAVRKVFANTIS